MEASANDDSYIFRPKTQALLDPKETSSTAFRDKILEEELPRIFKKLFLNYGHRFLETRAEDSYMLPWRLAHYLDTFGLFSDDCETESSQHDWLRFVNALTREYAPK